ncbi:MAG: lipoprotein-releasing ABC transporter permease subunit [Lautropia sp.]
MNAFEWIVGLRYTRGARRTGGRDRFISFIAWMSVAGIGLGVAALIVVLSVINGFQREVRDRMLSVVSHVEVYARRADFDWHALAAQALREPGVVAAAPFFSGQAVATRDDVMRGVAVRGVDARAEAGVSGIAGEMRSGTLDALVPGGAGVVVGAALARQLSIGVGDRLALVAPAAGGALGGAAAPRVRSFGVVGVFESGHFEYDSTLVLMAADDAMRFFEADGLTGIRLKVAEPDDAPAIAARLADRLGRDTVIRDWSAENRIWFASVQVQKRMLAIILALIVGVAAFNLVSMLVMAVTDKRSDIAILRTLGASPQSILAIFMIQGAAVGLIGTLVGVVLGVVLSLNLGALLRAVEALFGFQVLDPAVYLLSELPTRVRATEVASIALVSTVLALIATIYPSLRAARVKPAQALRHE